MNQCGDSDDSSTFWTSFWSKHNVLKEPQTKKKEKPTTHNWLLIRESYVSETTRNGDSRVEILLKIPVICFVSFPSSGLFFPFSVGFLLFLSCHSGMLAAFHCKFKAHSGNHWRRPGNLHSFVRRENKRWRKHAVGEFSKSPWQHELSNNAVNHMWTGLDTHAHRLAHIHTVRIMENLSMIGCPKFLSERRPRIETEQSEKWRWGKEGQRQRKKSWSITNKRLENGRRSILA